MTGSVSGFSPLPEGCERRSGADSVSREGVDLHACEVGGRFPGLHDSPDSSMMLHGGNRVSWRVSTGNGHAGPSGGLFFHFALSYSPVGADLLRRSSGAMVVFRRNLPWTAVFFALASQGGSWKGWRGGCVCDSLALECPLFECLLTTCMLWEYICSYHISVQRMCNLYMRRGAERGGTHAERRMRCRGG